MNKQIECEFWDGETGVIIVDSEASSEQVFWSFWDSEIAMDKENPTRDDKIDISKMMKTLGLSEDELFPRNSAPFEPCEIIRHKGPVCICGLHMYFSQDHDAYICECGNELELHNTLFSGDPICPCEA